MRFRLGPPKSVVGIMGRLRAVVLATQRFLPPE